jgi:hypothetical protein
MPDTRVSRRIPSYPALVCAASAILFACTDGPKSPTELITSADLKPVVQILTCSANTVSATVSCEPSLPQVGSGLKLDQKILGGQGIYVRLTSSGAAYNSGTQIFSFNVTVQNLTSSPLATADGPTRDDAGVRVFFSGNPVASPSGVITVANPTGVGTFTGANQAYFQYGGKIGGVDQGELGADGILAASEVSTSKPWQLNVPNTVTSFTFAIYVAAEAPAGEIVSAAPKIDSIKPATLIPGDSAFIFGKNLNATAGSNTINVGGQTTAGTRLDAKGLKFTVPCILSGTVPVTVTTNSMTGVARNAALLGNVRTLAVGQTVIIRNTAQVPCNEIANAGGAATYVATVYSANTSAGGNDPIQISGDPAADGAVADRVATDAVNSPLVAAAPLPGDHYDFGFQAMVDKKHYELLEKNRVAFNQLKTRFAGDKRMRTDVVSQAPVGPTPPPLTKLIRLSNIVTVAAGKNICNDYYTIPAHRVYYSGKIAIYEDDSTPVAFKDSANPTMHDYYTKIGDQFNNDMEPILSANFGNVLLRDPVTDNNGVLIALFTPKINNAFSGVAGFVVSCDQFPNDSTGPGTFTNSASNFGEYFFAYQPNVGGTGFTGNTADNWYRTIRSTFIHESKHVVAYEARVVNGAASFESSGMEEGMARTSEEMWARQAIYAPIPWKSDYGYGSLADPKNIYCDVRPAGFPECTFTRGATSVLQRHFTSLYTNMFGTNARLLSPFGVTASDNASYFYATSWSLIRFATDHFATGTEGAFLTALTNSTTTGAATLAGVAGVPIDSILGGWATSFATDNYPALDLATANPISQNLTWNLRNIYAGLNSDFPSTYTLPYPVTPSARGFGSFAPVDVTTLRGGGILWYSFSGTQSAPQLIRLKASGGGTLSSNVKITITRVQ